MRWLRQPVVIRRGAIIAASVFIGGLCALGILLGRSALQGLNAEREQRAQQIVQAERRRTDARILDRGQIANIASRQARLERPTRRELARRLLSALDLIGSTPSLRERAGQLPPALVAAGLATGPLPRSPRRAPRRRSTPRRRVTPTPTSHPAPKPVPPAAPSPTSMPPPANSPDVGLDLPCVDLRVVAVGC